MFFVNVNNQCLRLCSWRLALRILFTAATRSSSDAKIPFTFEGGLISGSSYKRNLKVEESCTLCPGFYHLWSLNVVTTIHFLYRGWRQLLNHTTPLSLCSHAWRSWSCSTPQQYIDKEQFFKNDRRRTYAGMVDILDEAVGDITEAFRTAGFMLRRSLSSSRHYTDYIIKRFFKLWLQLDHYLVQVNVISMIMG